MIGDNIIIS